MRIFTVLMLFFVILLSNNDYLLASTTGYTGRLTSGTGCTSCHSTQNTAISLTHSGSTTVVGGTKVDWTITVARTSATKSGIDIGVKNSSGATVGTVSTTATGLKVASGEITHSSTRTMSGGSYVYSFSWTAPTTPGTYYLRALAVAGAATTNNWNYMTPITITVTAAPTVSITKPIGAESWCMNSSQNITWNSSNIDNVRIELSSDGGATFGTEIVASTPASAGTYAWTVPSSLIALNTYKVRISDASNSTYKSISPANFTILPLTAIKTNPVAKTICENEGVIFTVVADGSALHYEWRHNDVLVSNPIDAPTLQLTKCTPDMSGNYTCIITGACGLAVTTTAVKLTINKPVAILSQPISQIVCKGTPASIKFSVTGTSLKFQWKKNGTAINGKTDSILSFPAIVSSDSGSYTCDVSSSCGSIITSDAAVFTYNSNPQISKQPVAVTALENDSVAIGVIATGGNLQYKWKKNGVDIVPAVNSPYLIFSKVATTNAGDYNCIISNNCNSVSSSTAKLTVNKTAGGPILKLSMSSFSFDTVKANIEKDTIINEVIKNTGDQDLVISSIALNGADASLYSLIPPVLPKTLKPGETTNLEIKFSGTICGAKEAIVNVKSNATEENLALYAYVINTSVGFDQFVAFYTIDKGQKEIMDARIENAGCIDLPLTIEIYGAKDCSEFTTDLKYYNLKVGEKLIVPVVYTANNNTHHDSCMIVFKNQWLDKEIAIPLLVMALGVEDNATNSLISPNPARDYIEINAVISNEVRNPGFEIFNIFGENTTPSNLSGMPPHIAKEGIIRLDISNFAPGVYFIKIGDKVEKFIKL